MQKVLYVGLDVHKVSISVTVAEDGREGAVNFIGAVRNTPAALSKLSKRLPKDGHRTGVLLRSWLLRLCHLSPAEHAGKRLHCRRNIHDPAQAGGTDQD